MAAGKWLVMIGLGLVAAGLLAMLGSKLGLPRLGKLPGDIVYKGENTTFYFPVVTCVVLSILLTIVLSLFQRR